MKAGGRPIQPARYYWPLAESHMTRRLFGNMACRLNKPNPPAQPRATSWGAIAYSAADMGAGWSQGKSERASAEKEAMNICSQRGKACALRIAFNKQCRALAADRDFTGSGVSMDQTEA